MAMADGDFNLVLAALPHVPAFLELLPNRSNFHGLALFLVVPATKMRLAQSPLSRKRKIGLWRQGAAENTNFGILSFCGRASLSEAAKHTTNDEHYD